MDQKTLVKETLSSDMIEAGKRLLEVLEEGGWQVGSAFWFFEEEENRWRLYISSLMVEKHGPRNAYERVSQAMAVQKIGTISLEHISILPMRHKLVQLFKSAVATGPTFRQIRFSRNTINGQFIPDALIYRSQ